MQPYITELATSKLRFVFHLVSVKKQVYNDRGAKWACVDLNSPASKCTLDLCLVKRRKKELEGKVGLENTHPFGTMELFNY